MPTRRLAIATLALFATLAPLRAAITLHLDPATEQFYFTGSDSGTFPVIPGGEGNPPVTVPVVVWGIGGSAIDDEPSTAPDIGTAFAVDSGLGVLPQFEAFPDGFSVSLFALTAEPQATLTANSGPTPIFSYSGFGTKSKAFLTSLVGSDIPLVQGDSFSPLHVAAIPEPSTYAALLGASALAVVVYRRRRRA